jgi:periplasmic copper chaperone A
MQSTPTSTNKELKTIMKRIVLATAAAGALAIPATASAHVTVQPKTAAAGAYTVESVRVPNETDNAVTNKITVQFPDGFAEVSYQAVPGWTVKVTKERLATPVRTDDGEVTEGVKTITWTSAGKTDGIKPGQFQDFPLSVQIPGKAGDTLTFKALQYYSDGSVARWIGAPDADKPAPQVQVTAAPAATTGASATAGTATTENTAAPASGSSSSSDSSSDSSRTLAIIALIVGALGLAAGGAGLAASRRSA